METMDFCSAMDALKRGSTVTRLQWLGDMYFRMVDDGVKSFRPRISPYVFNEDIMISNGWLIEGEGHKTFDFCEIIPLLNMGLNAWLKDWTDSYIYYSKDEKRIMFRFMDVFPYMPDFESFTMSDWVEL